MRLHVLTAVSRPENLGRVAESLAEAGSFGLTWHWEFDLERRHVGGQALKNRMLDEIDDGWVLFLDDDTVLHADFFYVVLPFVHAEFDAVIVSQLRTDGRVLRADPDNVRLGFIDIGQAFLRRELIADRRIPEDYNGDCFWLQEVLAPPARVAWLPDVVSLHNAISGVDVGV